MSHRNPVALRIADSFFRHRWLFVISVLVVSGITVAAVATKSNTYTATALTQVSVDRVAVALGEKKSSGWTSLAQENVNHFQDLSNDDLPGGFLDAALKDAQLSTPINFEPKQNDPRALMLHKGLVASTQSDNTFSIALTWDNPAEAERIVRALQSRYREEVGQDRAASGIAAGQFLDQQIQLYEGQMKRAEEVLIKYRSGDTAHLPDIMNSAVSQLASLTAQRDNVKITLQDSGLRISNLQSRLNQLKPTTVIEQTHSESPLLAKLNETKVQRDAMAVRYFPGHPKVAELNALIASMQKQWDEKVRNGTPETKGISGEKTQDNPEYLNVSQQLTEAKITQQTQAAQLSNLNQAIAMYNTQVQKMPDAQRTLNNYTRDYSLVKDQYEDLRKKREQVRIDSDLNQISASSTINPLGYINAVPTMNRTKKAAMMLGGVVLGFVIGALLLLLSEWTDRSLRYPEDAERLLGVPVLAMLPDSSSLNMPTVSGNGAAGRRLAGETGGPKGALGAPGAATASAMTSRADG